MTFALFNFSIATSSVAARSIKKKNFGKDTLLAFMAFFGCVCFFQKFSADSLPTPNFLRWVHSKLCSGAEDLVALFSEKQQLPGNFTKFMLRFPRAKTTALCELCNEQARQILRTSMCFHRFNNTDARVGDISRHVFILKHCSLTYVIRGPYVQLAIIDGGPKRPNSLAGLLSQPSCFKVLFYLHALCFLDWKWSDIFLRVAVI